MSDFPTVITKAGLQPQSPTSLLALLLAGVAATNPGYTANLPGSLIEDVASTDVGALVVTDSAKVETVNSLTPYGANAFLLNQLGQMLGIQLGTATNTSVFCIFTGTPGFVVAVGFTVSDGTFQYTVQDGGIIGAGGTSDELFCLATISGSWAVPPGTVTELITSVPSSVTLSVNNPASGLPGVGGQTEESYRAQVLQANLAASQGMSRYLKTLLGNVSGVQQRLISAQAQTGGGWEIICGGGDPYEVANAIYQSLFDISTLVGSTIAISGITKTNPGVVTTTINHGLVSGQSNVFIAGVLGMTAANGGPYTVTVISETTFSFAVDTSGFATYTGGGVVTPNSRNISVTIYDSPDSYLIPFVNPPQQSVTMTVTWDTTSTNLVDPSAVAQAGAPALVDYVNALQVGTPINLFELQTVFQEAIADILTPQLLTRMVFAVSINSVPTSPSAGTGIIAGDPESYFLTAIGFITITQG